MLGRIVEEYHNLFPVIFGEASECMQLVFGINVIEVDPNDHSYALITNLDLTYDGIVDDEHSLPKTGILILILCIIFMEGNRVSEEEIWEKLSFMGVHDGREHCIYGEPRELLTKIWVQEQYLEYRQVPNSSPPRYEFLWGPRVHIETSKMKVLEFLAKINDTEPRSFPLWYEEALRDEEERSQARMLP
ncbi:Melanoma-associated antigen 10 [Pteropus alecto]|uniref:Melanoma-associated antigen 10 n=2 Tax=Pteropus alecto TaxID=9402 RepID=L5L6V9_PTEAL|nr:Melanoma-associated antigen 10 [Pteropus alecto]